LVHWHYTFAVMKLRLLPVAITQLMAALQL